MHPIRLFDERPMKMNEHRSNYRKNLKVGGTLVSDNTEISFFTKNVSLSGFQAYSTEAKQDVKPLEKGDLVYVRLPMLNLEGVASMVWTETAEDGVFNFGFKFLNMRGVEGSAYHYKGSDQEESHE